MSTAENIKTILSEQVVAYRTLLDILQREREALIRFNARSVEELSKEKDTAVLKLRLLEEERCRLVRVYATAESVPEADAFKRLHEAAGDDSFQRLRLQLISLLQSITELNSFNRVLIERSAGVVKNALAFLNSFGVAANRPDQGTLLSREA